MAKSTVIRVHKDLQNLLENSEELGLDKVGRSKLLADFAKAQGFPSNVKIQRIKKKRRGKEQIVLQF